ncbi:MAG: hypothetical protein FWC11_05935 [Firmicutes bacterium]|nr:hypothetical protein [Bacillota bacterium]
MHNQPSNNTNINLGKVSIILSVVAISSLVLIFFVWLGMYISTEPPFWLSILFLLTLTSLGVPQILSLIFGIVQKNLKTKNELKTPISNIAISLSISSFVLNMIFIGINFVIAFSNILF